jgi:hypothetical protein
MFLSCHKVVMISKSVSSCSKYGLCFMKSKLSFYISCLPRACLSMQKRLRSLCAPFAYNVLPLAAVGDFEALHCQPSTNFDRSTALDLTTSAPIAANGCYAVGFLFCRLFVEWFPLSFFEINVVKLR